MIPKFGVVIRPSFDLLATMAALNPRNPFCTSGYSSAREALGDVPCVFSVQIGHNIVAGCVAFLRGKGLKRTLEISSLPALVISEPFWDGVQSFCRQYGVWELSVESFASEKAMIPSFATELSRRSRWEYVLELNHEDPLRSLCTQHRRNITKARKAGMQLRRSRSADGCLSHAELVNASMERRKDRGEDVELSTDSKVAEALISTGVGEIFQLIKEDKVLSSILVLRAEQGAYYQSAGTSLEGMAMGASPFLIFEVAAALKQEGLQIFNLGGAEPENPGLLRFKRGFGAKEVRLEAASFSMTSPFKRRMRSAIRMLRHEPMALVRHLLSVERFVVYDAQPGSIAPPIHSSQMKFEKLTDERLLGLCGSMEFSGQAERFDRLKFNDAYGLVLDNKLVHVAWLVSAAHDRRVVVRNVRLRAGEAEITHCETKEEFRGRGYYPLAIQYLCEIAAKMNVSRVYMITGTQNVASQRGIEKAGFSRCGFITRIVFPPLSARLSLTFRGHRWSLRQALDSACDTART